jgi:hypothetical protein
MKTAAQSLVVDGYVGGVAGTVERGVVGGIVEVVERGFVGGIGGIVERGLCRLIRYCAGLSGALPGAARGAVGGGRYNRLGGETRVDVRPSAQ